MPQNIASSISVSIIKLLSGRIAIQVLSFITVPIVTRFFLPYHFGVIQLFSSIAVVITMISCLKYELSIPLAQDDKEALASLVLSALSTLCITLFVTIIVVLWRERIASGFKTPELETFLWFLPLVVFVNGFGNALIHWAAREQRFGAIALSDLGQFLPERLIQMIWGPFIGASASGLFIARFVGIGVRFGVLFISLSRKLISALKPLKLSFETLWAVGKRHKKFPLFTTWAIFLNSVAAQLIPFFFGTSFSATVVGYYSLGYRVIRLPMTMLSTSIQKVFFSAAAGEYNQHGSLTNIVSTFFTRLIQIGVFPTVTLCILGPTLFKIVFGQQWEIAGIYAQITAILHFMTFINTCLKIFEIVNRQELRLFLNIFATVGKIIGLLIGVKMISSPIIALGIFVTISVSGTLVNLVWQLELAQVSTLWALKTLVLYIAISCILLSPVTLLSGIMKGSEIVLGALVCATGTYVILLWRIDPSFRNFMRFMLNKLTI